VINCVVEVLCHGRNTDGDSHRFTGDSNPDETLSKVRIRSLAYVCHSSIIIYFSHHTESTYTLYSSVPGLLSLAFTVSLSNALFNCHTLVLELQRRDTRSRNS